jgi:hypothetical protein
VGNTLKTLPNPFPDLHLIPHLIAKSQFETSRRFGNE